MPKISAAAAARRRAHILEAVRHCVAEHGIHVSVDEICARARVSKGAFYGYFDSKDAAIQALVQAHGRVVTTFAALDSAAALLEHIEALTTGRTAAWHRLELEFWTHSLKQPALRVAIQHNMDSLRRALSTAIAALPREGTAPVAPAVAAEILALISLGLVASSALGSERGARASQAALHSLAAILLGDPAARRATRTRGG